MSLLAALSLLVQPPLPPAVLPAADAHKTALFCLLVPVSGERGKVRSVNLLLPETFESEPSVTPEATFDTTGYLPTGGFQNIRSMKDGGYSATIGKVRTPEFRMLTVFRGQDGARDYLAGLGGDKVAFTGRCMFYRNADTVEVFEKMNKEAEAES